MTNTEADIETSATEPSALGLKLLIIGLLTISAISIWKATQNTVQPQQSQQTQQTQQSQPIRDEQEESFTEQAYKETLHKCLFLGQRELEQFQGVVVKQFQRDIQDNINESGISPRITLLRKLNFVRGNLTQRISEQTHFGGRAQSRGIVRPSLLDSLSILYAMKAEVDGIVVENVELSPAEYLDCLDELNYWGKKAETLSPEFQRLRRLPRQETAQINEQINEENEKRYDWNPY